MSAILRVRDEDGNIAEIPAIRGRSAYEYAKDGGFTGSEAEFAEKLAAEYLKPTDVVDNLLSDSSDLPLSAKQGGVLEGMYNELSSNDISVTVNEDFILDGAVVARRHGKVCIIDFSWKVKAGTYANSDVLGTCSIGPDHTARALLNFDPPISIRVLSNGQITFNSSTQTFSSDYYLLGQITFISK